MAKKTKKALADVCFPVPHNFALTTTSVPATIESNEVVKKSLFQQTIKTAYQISIPSSFTSSWNREKPYQLVSEEQIEMVSSLFQAIQPQDASEAALAQQFIIVLLLAIDSAKSGLSDRDIKKLELSHQILETLQKYRSKGAQQIQVNYNHNQGQINNINMVNQETAPTTIEGEVL